MKKYILISLLLSIFFLLNNKVEVYWQMSPQQQCDTNIFTNDSECNNLWNISLQEMNCKNQYSIGSPWIITPEEEACRASCEDTYQYQQKEDNCNSKYNQCVATAQSNAWWSWGAWWAWWSWGTWWTTCTWWSIINWQCVVNNAWNMWIDMDSQCLINWQCKFDIYQTLWIRQSLPRETRSSPWIFVQDIILSATFFVGTLITWVLIISWLLFVFSWVNAGLADKAKKWITGSLVWLLFVVWSYAFVRLIQFLVTWWWG